MTKEPATAQLLTAASILAGLLTFLWGAAYRTITKALDIERGERQRADLRAERRQLQRALAPAIAVFVTGVALALVFAREVFELVRAGEVFTEWDAIGLSLIVVWLAFALVGLHALTAIVRLRRKYGELNEP